MPTLSCPGCDQELALHELDTKTVTRPGGFETTLRCPRCGSALENLEELL